MDHLEPRRQVTSVVEPTSIVLLMEIVAQNFHSGRPTKLKELAEKAGLPEPVVRQMVDRLIQTDLLHAISGSERSVTLAQPPDRIPIDQLIEIGFQVVDAAQMHHSTLQSTLRDVQIHATRGETLASLMVT